MDIVVDTRSVLISSWLPEFLHLVAGVIVIKNKLGEIRNDPETSKIGLSSNIESTPVAHFTWLAFVFVHFRNAVDHT